MCKLFSVSNDRGHALRVPLIIFLSMVVLLSGCTFVDNSTTMDDPQLSLPADLETQEGNTPDAALTPTQAAPSVEPSVQPKATLPQPSPTAYLDYFSTPYPISAVKYVIPLSMRLVGEEEAVLFFELSEARAGVLVYRTLEAQSLQQHEIQFGTEKKRHLVRLDGLQSGQKYQSEVFLYAEGGNLEKPAFSSGEWGAVTFRTASGQEPLRVGVLGDASFGDQATITLVQQMATYPLDFVLHSGDVADVTEQGANPYQSYMHIFFIPFSPLLHRMPVYTVLGNHDYDRDIQLEGKPYYDYAFPGFEEADINGMTSPERNQYYSFSYNNVQFLMLDSQVFFGVSGREAQEEWLDERLADPQYRFSIVVLHVSPFSSSVVHPQDGLPVRYTWTPKFAAAKVPVVFSGHYQHYERLLSEGVNYIVTGGGSSILYAKGESLPESQIYIRRTHFVLMEIYSDRIQLTAITMEGETIDQLLIPLQ